MVFSTNLTEDDDPSEFGFFPHEDSSENVHSRKLKITTAFLNVGAMLNII